MTVINKDIRRAVIEAAIDYAKAPRLADLNAAGDELAEKAWRNVFPGDVLKAAASLPSGWLRVDKILLFNVAGKHIRLEHQSGLPVPSDNWGRKILGAIKSGSLADAIMEHIEALKALKDDCDQIRAQLSALLDANRTLERLAEAWPEGVRFFPEIKAKAVLPAVQIGELNKAIGIAA